MHRRTQMCTFHCVYNHASAPSDLIVLLKVCCPRRHERGFHTSMRSPAHGAFEQGGCARPSERCRVAPESAPRARLVQIDPRLDAARTQAARCAEVAPGAKGVAEWPRDQFGSALRWLQDAHSPTTSGARCVLRRCRGVDGPEGRLRVWLMRMREWPSGA